MFRGYAKKIICLVFVSLMMLVSNLQIKSLYAQDITLSAEQINEVEKEPGRIIENCSNRITLETDPGKLCDVFYNYLNDKCKRLDNIPDYCGGLFPYAQKKSNIADQRFKQKACNLNPPLLNDTEGIKKCFEYVDYGSIYPGALLFSLEGVSLDTANGVIEPSFSVVNLNKYSIGFAGIIYTISKQGHKLSSDWIGDRAPNPTTAMEEILPLGSGGYAGHGKLTSALNTLPPYVVNGTYRYLNQSSGVVTTQFNFTYYG